MANPSKIRISHDPAAEHFLRVEQIRLDVSDGEPQCLGNELEIAPGDTVSVPLHFGGSIVITEKLP